MVTRTTATSVVVVDPGDIRAVAASAAPRDALSALILQQADLIKASPFIHNGVTPPRLFTGRRGEGARWSRPRLKQRRRPRQSADREDLVSAMGPRNAGRAGPTVYYGDCQAVGDWERFRALAKRDWDVVLAEQFEPDQVAELVERLTTGEGAPIFILDEIDRLVAWDRNTEVGGVTEAFFRSLRAQSQAGKAQFVFSGERTIAEVLWSPASPHWNFCQRLSLRQLNREDAAQLLFKVLASLSVEFEAEAEAEAVLWSATSGHPRLVQLLGDQLVRRLNERPGDERDRLTPADLADVIDTFDFKSEYVETYWGQATMFERHLTRLVAEGERSLERLQELMAEEDEPLALKVLELYGIFDVVDDEVQLRASSSPSFGCRRSGAAAELMALSEFHVGGHVPVDSPAYVDRDFVQRCFDELVGGRWVVLLGPSQHGKTSGLVRLVEMLKDASVKVAQLSLQGMPRMTSSSELFEWIAGKVAEQLEVDFASPGQAERAELDAWLAAALPPEPTQVVIVFDEAAAVKDDDIRSDFYQQLRRLHDERNAPRSPNLGTGLTMLFSGTFEPKRLVNDDLASPFNVCRTVETEDLPKEAVAGLVERLGALRPPRGRAGAGPVGGQPFLLQYLFSEAERGDAATSAEERFEETEEKLLAGDSEHLTDLLSAIVNDQPVRTIAQQVVEHGAVPFAATPEHRALVTLGFGRREGTRLVARNRLYSEVASRHFLLASDQAAAVTGKVAPPGAGSLNFMADSDLRASPRR